MTSGGTPNATLAMRLSGDVWGHLVGDAVEVPYEGSRATGDRAGRAARRRPEARSDALRWRVASPAALGRDRHSGRAGAAALSGAAVAGVRPRGLGRHAPGEWRTAGPAPGTGMHGVHVGRAFGRRGARGGQLCTGCMSDESWGTEALAAGRPVGVVTRNLSRTSCRLRPRWRGSTGILARWEGTRVAGR